MDLPLFLTYRGVIIGTGYIADVSARTKMLATKQGETTWLYGVQPGAVAACGPDLDQAHAEMREILRLKFIGLAKDAVDFAAFRSAAADFFDATEDDDLVEWKSAVAAIRADQAAAERTGLPIVKAEAEPFIVITEIKPAELRPEMNPSVCEDGPQLTTANVGLAAVA